MKNRGAIPIVFMCLAVIPLFLSVAGCGGSRSGQKVVRAAMSQEEEARCDTVQDYLLGARALESADQSGLWVEGVMKDDAWPFRVVTIDSTGKVTVAGTGTFNIKRWSLSIQPTPESASGPGIATVTDFSLPSSEIDNIRSVWATGCSEEYGSIAVRRALVLTGWLRPAQHFECLWFDNESVDGWISYYLLAIGAEPKHDLVLCWPGRVRLKDNRVEYNPYTEL